MKLGNKELQVPIIQGGMGVGVSLSSLAGNVAKCGGMGVISSVNAGYREEDFLTNPKEANLRALANEIKKAKEIACGNGIIAVNIMTAVSNYAETCMCAIKAGVDAIISGAGLPLNLPEFVKGTKTMCAPIVSSARAARLLLKQYKKHYEYNPDFLIIEGSQAGGHLGFSTDELINDTAKTNEEILSEVLEVCEGIPVFVAGGDMNGTDLAHLEALGASGIQLATRFIATHECDASDVFKNAIVNATEEDIIIIESPVGMPARAINSPLMKRIKAGEKFLAVKCNGCLTACKKNDEIPYCISRALIEAVKGNWEDGLFFTGSQSPIINKIVSVQEVISQIMKDYEVAKA